MNGRHSAVTVLHPKERHNSNEGSLKGQNVMQQRYTMLQRIAMSQQCDCLPGDGLRAQTV